MAYDPDLAARIRALLADQPHMREVKMFGGLTFMVNDKMTAVANTHGGLMVRCSPDNIDALLQQTGASWPQMRGRPMSRGWVVVTKDAVATDTALRFWIKEALQHNKEEVGRGSRRSASRF